MERTLVSLFVVCVTLTVIEATVCTKDSQCGINQCCYIKPEFMVVSKRVGSMLVLPVQSTHRKTGVCETYKSAGDLCGVFEKSNGHCSCGAGLQCGWVPDHPTTGTPAGRRSVVPVYHPEPGSHQCTTKH